MRACRLTDMRDRYIQMLAAGSRTPQHELIVECLEYYGAYGTRELTEQQLKEFAERRLSNVFKSINTKQNDETGV